MRLRTARDSRKVTRSAADAGRARIGATCGYNCHNYSDAVALRKEEWINRCQSGKQISRMFRNLHSELSSTRTLSALNIPSLADAMAAPARLCFFRPRPAWGLLRL